MGHTLPEKPLSRLIKRFSSCKMLFCLRIEQSNQAGPQCEAIGCI